MIGMTNVVCHGQKNMRYKHAHSLMPVYNDPAITIPGKNKRRKELDQEQGKIVQGNATNLYRLKLDNSRLSHVILQLSLPGKLGELADNDVELSGADNIDNDALANASSLTTTAAPLAVFTFRKSHAYL
jgi:hypothetical protein